MQTTFEFDPMQSEEFSGRQFTNKTFYQPFETVSLTLERKKVKYADLYIYDAKHNLYAGRRVRMKNGKGRMKFEPLGELGTHTIRILYDDKVLRCCFFRLEAQTRIETGQPEFDGIQPYLEDISAKCCAELEINGRRVSLSGRAGDTTLTIWFRDGGYGLLAYVYWHPYLKEFCDFFLSTQDKTGFFRGTKLVTLDNLSPEFGRCSNEPDLEYIAVLVVHRVWQATGDDLWLEKCMPKLEKGLKTIMTKRKNSYRMVEEYGRMKKIFYRNSWDAEHGLVKRTHTCDTWDFQQDKPDGSPVYVMATCDQSGYYLAMNLLGKMYRHLRNRKKSSFWIKNASAFRKRANTYLWDGRKFLHHKHIDDLDHGDFNESEQLAMGNTWAMTRQLATHSQCVSIIKEYQKRWKKTGDKWPWWSLQPGYPTGTFGGAKSGFWAKVLGCYANGGLISWVGGELAFAALEHGFEDFGVKQIKLYHEMLKENNGGNNTWYWPDGRPGLSTPRSTDHSIWDIGAWMRALQEGLAGIKDDSKQFGKTICSPKWPAAQVKKAKVVSAYPGSGKYFAYLYEYNPASKEIQLKFSGTGETVDFSIMLPKRKKISCVQIDGIKVKYKIRDVEKSSYCEFSSKIRKTIARQAFSYFKERFEERAIPLKSFDINIITIKLVS